MSLFRKGAISRRLAKRVPPLLSDPDLLSYLGFEEGSGDKASDAYIWTMGDPTKVSWVTGKVGKALQFNGLAGSYLTTPYSSKFDLQIFSISMWVKYTVYSPWAFLYCRYWSDVEYKPWGTGLYVVETPSEDAGKIQFFAYHGVSGEGAKAYIRSLKALNDDEWHHLVGTYNGSALELFVDNVSQGTLEQELIYYANTPVVIAARTTYVNRYVGIVDEFYLFSKVLSELERNLLYKV